MAITHCGYTAELCKRTSVNLISDAVNYWNSRPQSDFQAGIVCGLKIALEKLNSIVHNIVLPKGQILKTNESVFFYFEDSIKECADNLIQYRQAIEVEDDFTRSMGGRKFIFRNQSVYLNVRK